MDSRWNWRRLSPTRRVEMNFSFDCQADRGRIGSDQSFGRAGITGVSERTPAFCPLCLSR